MNFDPSVIEFGSQTFEDRFCDIFACGIDFIEWRDGVEIFMIQFQEDRIQFPFEGFEVNGNTDFIQRIGADEV